MTMPREKVGSQPEYDDKGIVTFEVHHRGRMVKSSNLNEWWFYVGGSIDYLDWCLLDYINLLEIYVYAKELGYHDQVVVTEIQNVIVIYLEHPTVINVDEFAAAWRERGPIARNLTAEFEHEDESDEQFGYEGMYEEDEDDDIAVLEICP
ncbi:unnamed protein product [Prunus armeniaca]